MNPYSEMNTHVCPFNHELLAGYVSGNCTPEERLVAERHLAQCPQCRREVLELEKTWWALDVWQEDHIPVKPRLNDLHMRLAAHQERRGVWQALQKSFHCRLALWRFKLSALRFSPAASLATLLFGILATGLGLVTTQFRQPGFTISPVMVSGPNAGTVMEEESAIEEKHSSTRAISSNEKSIYSRIPVNNSKKSYLNEKIRMGYDGQLISVNSINIGHMPSREISSIYHIDTPSRPAASYPLVLYMDDRGMGGQ
ncbi:MAG TPA: zf-HC2 domain-containing protein [bacterium]|nr:hypothetical protein [Candidatus Omnitrophota bacterium]HOJ60078.1 zf-HC2 domain-containing protein [bacterium]HOL94858.1 zf-HC2 domain-containing protein [bacterium]HXK94617.1 zf-HC2 domain-containing protein [bacterium]